MLGGSLAGLSPKFVYKKNSQPPMSEFTFIDVHIIYIYTHMSNTLHARMFSDL